MNSKSVLWIILKSLSFHKYLFLLQFLFFYKGVVQAQWVQSNGPTGGIVNCLAVSGTNLFAGTDYGVYLSTNNGTSWAQTGLTGSSVKSLVISSTNIFAGTYRNGVYLSNNNGTSWTQVNKGIPYPTTLFL
jgi:hypothetical protein